MRWRPRCGPGAREPFRCTPSRWPSPEGHPGRGELPWHRGDERSERRRLRELRRGPGVDGPERVELPAAARCAAGRLADPRSAGRPAGGRGARGRRVHRLAGRLPGPGLESAVPGRSAARPGRRPALHPGHHRQPGGPRHHPVVVGDRAGGPGRDDRPARTAAEDPRLLRAAGALPRQGRDVLPAVRLPPRAARRRRRRGAADRPRGRLGLRAVGDRSVLVGRHPLRPADRRPAPQRAASAPT